MERVIIIILIMNVMLIAQNGQELLYDQEATAYTMAYTSMADSTMDYWTRIADNFSLPYGAWIEEVVWWGTTW